MFGGVALIAVIVAAYFLLRDDEGSNPSSYHFVASLDVQNSSGAEDRPFNRIEGWYEPGRGLRLDLDYDDPSLAGMGSKLFSNSDGLVFYDGKTNTYTKSDRTEIADRYPDAGYGLSFFLGPLAAESIDDLFPSGTGATSQQTGSERAFGLDLDVIQVTGGTGGTSTFWIDPKRNFVVRYQSNEAPQTIDAEMQSLEFGNDIDDGIFAFVPPPDAVEAQPSSSSGGTSLGPFGGPAVPTLAGFLAVKYLPAGYLALAGSTTGSTGRTSAYTVSLGVDKVPTLFIEQQYRAGGALPVKSASAETVTVNGHDGYQTTVNGEKRLVWSDGDIVVTLRTTTLHVEELTRIAESMHFP
jgi:outer membrane lipoprotein-sorting protein